MDSSTRIKRVFIGWDRPLLHALRDFILDQSATPGDLGSMSVVLPGARAGRRLLELLTPPGGAVIPPRILTLGAWAALGLPVAGAPAGPLARLAAWKAALGKLDESAREAVVRIQGRPNDERAGLRWIDAARLIDACHAELSGEAMRFADIARRAPEAQDFTDAERWQALAAAQRLYEDELRTAGLVDAALARIDSLERRALDREALVGSGEGTVVLAGISEMNAVARRVVEGVADRCVVLVAAPEEEAHRFDELGCVIPDAWESARIDLIDDAVIGAEGPHAQAAAALGVIEKIGVASATGMGVPVDQITIGVPDAEVEERLRRLAGRLGNVPVRRAEGTPVSFTRPVKLMLATAEYVQRRDFSSLAALVRHPDVERWIASTTGARPERWLEVLDEYQSKHLHGHVDGTWLTAEETEKMHATLGLLHDAVSDLLGGAIPGDSLMDDARREPAVWCARVWDVIRTIFSKQGFADAGAAAPRLDPATREACFVIHAHLAELAALPASLAAEMLLTPGETIRLIVQQAVGDAIPEPGENAAIDLVGWLELAADDAPWLIVTGMNEGRAPSASGIDPLLPEGLRRTLGLRDRRGRLARDAHAMLMMARCRQSGRAVFIFGRRSGDGDPLAPSRLLLMGDDESLLSRVRQWTGAEPASLQTAPLMLRFGRVSGFGTNTLVLPEPGDLFKKEIDAMYVTSFRMYLESPYGFYLRHVLRLEEVDDSALEMDGRVFGILIHDVLVKLSDAEIAACDDAERLAAFLIGHLDGVAHVRFGHDPRAEVWIQIEQARSRLRAFAHVQAQRAREGWRVVRTEWAPPPRVAHLMVDDKPMYLKGRIDRIDVNSRTGEWAVLDYKTGGKPPSMKGACSKDGEWRDPQLPLYRHLVKDLAAELGVTGEPRLAWIALPSAAAETAIVPADWSPEQLASADDTAADIVRRVRRGEFADTGRRPPSDGILGLLCGGLVVEEVEE